MAKRPIFIPDYNKESLVTTLFVDFNWFPGLSITQKQKSIQSLHMSAQKKFHLNQILEVSSKSPNNLGVELSAFNLTIETVRLKKKFTVECAFQASKVFQNGGPYIDLLDKKSIEAKKDERIKTSGNLLRFSFYGQEWPIEPKTAFYDWLYINALYQNDELTKQIESYDAFTDIEFNHEKSVNCQAYSIALFISLKRKNLLYFALKNKTNFISVISSFAESNANNNIGIQPLLL